MLKGFGEFEEVLKGLEAVTTAEKLGMKEKIRELKKKTEKLMKTMKNGDKKIDVDDAKLSEELKKLTEKGEEFEVQIKKRQKSSH